MDKRRNAIILCSGGADSVTTAYYIWKKAKYNNLILLFFNYGQRALISERKCSRTCANRLGAEFIEINTKEIANISDSGINSKKGLIDYGKKSLADTKKESDEWYVPFRNGIFLSYAIGLADYLYKKRSMESDIFVGFKCEGKEPFPDATEEFVKEMNNLSKISSESKPEIIAPLIKMDKEDIILLSRELGVNFKATFSCYVGNKKHCGKCLSCRLRKAGFYWAGVEDETLYE